MSKGWNSGMWWWIGMAFAFPYITAVGFPLQVLLENLLPSAPRFLVSYVLVGFGSFVIFFFAARFAYSHGAPRRLWVVGVAWAVGSLIVAIVVLDASGERFTVVEFITAYLDTVWLLLLETSALGLASWLSPLRLDTSASQRDKAADLTS